MHPILIQVGSLKLYTYGFFVALGFIIAIWFTNEMQDFMVFRIRWCQTFF